MQNSVSEPDVRESIDEKAEVAAVALELRGVDAGFSENQFQ